MSIPPTVPPAGDPGAMRPDPAGPPTGSVPPPGWAPQPPAGASPASLFTLPTDPAARQARLIDLGIPGAALLAFISALLPYYTVKVSFMGMSQSASTNGWDAWPSLFGVLLVVLGGAAFALVVFGVVPAAQRATLKLVSLGALAVGWLLVLLSLFWVPGQAGLSGMGLGDIVKIGRGIGFWLTFIFASVALAASVYLYLKATPRSPAPPAAPTDAPAPPVIG